MSVMPPPIVMPPRRWDERNSQSAQDRFYEEFGYDHHYRIVAFLGRIGCVAVRLFKRLRPSRRLTRPAAPSSC